MLDLASPLDGFESPFGARRNGFTEMTPFLNGALGLLYKPRPVVLFQDAAGITAVAAAADPVGLLFDDSKALALGTEKIINGTLDADLSGWAAVGDASPTIDWVSGELRVTVSGASGGEQIITTVAGKLHKVTGTIRRGTASDVRIRAVNTIAAGTLLAESATVTATSNTDVTFYFTAISTATSIYLRAGSAGTGFFDNISVKEIAGSHAVLSGTNTLRPIYQITPQRLVFDGSDDRLLTTLKPTASGTIAMRLRGTTASRVALGSQGASNGRAFLALAADGSLAAGIGADSTSTIKGTVDDRNAWVTGFAMWDGSTSKLYRNDTLVYSAPQNGAVNTTVPWMLGCLNNNATAASFWGGDIGAAMILDRPMTPAEIAYYTNKWSTIQ